MIDLTGADGLQPGSVVSLRRDRIPLVHPVTGELKHETYLQGKAVSDSAFESMLEQRAIQLKQKGFTLVRRIPKIGRNDPCPCNSGKKFKRCHLHLKPTPLEAS